MDHLLFPTLQMDHLLSINDGGWRKEMALRRKKEINRSEHVPMISLIHFMECISPYGAAVSSIGKMVSTWPAFFKGAVITDADAQPFLADVTRGADATLARGSSGSSHLHDCEILDGFTDDALRMSCVCRCCECADEHCLVITVYVS